MRDAFEAVADHLDAILESRESYAAGFHGERSDFARFNGARVRQAGSVTQASLELDLIDGRRHAMGSVSLTGNAPEDRRRVEELVHELRAMRRLVPEDPHLLVSTEAATSDRTDPDRLPDARAVAEGVVDRAAELDLVGVYAAGGLHDGFASSHGARHWQTTHSFHIDLSAFASADRAIKSSWGGFEWSDAELERRLAEARRALQVLGRPAKTLDPGPVRAYLSPAAMHELMQLLSWGGFGIRAHRTKTTPLLRMVEEDARLDPRVSLEEATEEGVAPAFQEAGFVRPGRVPLVERGQLVGALVSPRSAAEHGLETNGASSAEAPLSLAMAPGEVPRARALEHLGTGVSIGNLWYLNYSNRAAARVTGMTRFATFWVERGEIVAPVEVMRFDESLYRILGSGLDGLTDEAELLLSADSYERRSAQSARLPGAIVNGLSFVA